MPIEYRIDPERRLVVAKGCGTLTDQDIFAYQREVWSRAEVSGYDELMDMIDVTSIASPSSERIRELVKLSASMDPGSSPSRFATVAPDDLAFGLGRMYETYRSLDERSTKHVSVFRLLEDALAFLDVEGNL